MHKLLFLRCLLGLFPVCLSAQSVAGLGAITGLVSDATGARVPGAQVVVSNEAKGIRRALVTNEDGLFSAVSLVPAEGYAVSVSATGFAAYQASTLGLEVGQVIDLKVTLQVSAAATQVEVVSAAPVVDSTRTGVSQVVSEAQILNLPINGRRVDTFVLLTPGVTNDGQFGLVSFRGVPGGNAFLTDGNDTTQQYYNENAGRTRIAAQISQDAVQEFQVLTSGYSAEFGRSAGGTVNTVTRSGTNDLHGTAYWFYRDQNFNARDRYATFNPDERRNQAGGSLGGKILTDKLFYFTNAEISRRNYPLVSSLTAPPLFNTAGQFVGTCTASAPQCQAATAFVSRFNTTVPREANQELLFGKLDFRPTESQSISASFNYLRWISPNGIQTGATLTNGAAFGSNGISTVRTRYARLAWTSLLSPNLVNEARFGWFKDRLADSLNPDLNPPNGVLSTITVEGVANLGTANYLPRVQPSEDRFQFADNLSWTAGRHFLKFGVDVAQTRDVQDQLNNGRGSYSYANFTNFALDFSGNTTGERRWQSYSQTFGDPLSTIWVKDYNLFAQDQFRATRNLTLNLGVRYELATFTQPGAPNADYPQTGRIPEPKSNFAPRVGVAYSLNQDRTVLRAGYGLFYARFAGALVTTLNTVNSSQRSINLQGTRPAELALGPVFPNALGSLTGLPAAGATSLTFAGEDFRTPYTQQADFTVEQALGAKTSLSASYLWSRGLHFTTIRDANLGPLGAPVTYEIRDAAGSTTGSYTTPTYRFANRVDPRYQRLNVLESAGNIYYNALVVQLRNRTFRFGPLSTEGNISYTWSHTIDTNQGEGGDNLFFSGAPRTLFNGDFQGERGSSPLDQRHRLVVAQVADFRFLKSDGALARYLVNNWQLSTISTFASSQATTPTVFVSGTPFTGAAFNTSLNGLGGSSRVPFLPRNDLDIDTIARVDARVTKILPFTERHQLFLILEGFNIFGNVYDTSRNSQLYRATNGVLTPVANYGVGTASAGFPDGTNARRLQVSVRYVF